MPDSVIALEPEALALSYLSNSTVLQFFSSLGVNLDPFFKLLWRHVLTVEILNHHFGSSEDPREKHLVEHLTSFFSGTTARDKRAREAVEYLTKWGEKFWQETEYRVKEITQKVEGQLRTVAEGKVSLPLFGATATTDAGGRLSKEQTDELITRGQAIVSKAQVQDLSKVLDLLAGVLEDRQQPCLVTIDRLDENWVEERLRYRLIMALILTAREFLKVKNAKIVIALRRDLVERVFRLARASGFQEEKYQSLYLPLEWTKRDLLSLLDRRVNYLVRRRYTQLQVRFRDLVPSKIRRVQTFDYIHARAQRPRDIISFFNTCIDAAEGKPRITTQALRKAEGEWSRSRFRALGDEWSADDPRLLDFAALLRGRSRSFKLSAITEVEVEDFCLERAAEQPDGQGVLQGIALQLVDLLLTPEEARRQIVRVFYRLGLVGLKLAPHEAESWVDQLGRGVSTAEIGLETSIVVHPAFYRELGISDAQGS
jgi:hypothetical protein